MCKPLYFFSSIKPASPRPSERLLMNSTLLPDHSVKHISKPDMPFHSVIRRACRLRPPRLRSAVKGRAEDRFAGREEECVITSFVFSLATEGYRSGVCVYHTPANTLS